MPVKMVYGPAGAGKSYFGVNVLLKQSVANGRTILTNLPLNLEEWEKDYPDKVGNITLVDVGADFNVRVKYDELPDDLLYDDEGEKIPKDKISFEKVARKDQSLVEVKFGSVDVLAMDPRPEIYFDEAATIFPPKETSKHVQEFFRVHRHLYLDCVLLAQDDTFVDPGVRKNASGIHDVRKRKSIGFPLLQETYYDDKDRKTDPVVNTQRFAKKGFRYYESRTLGGGSGHVEQNTGTQLHKRWQFWAGLAVFAWAFWAWVINDPFERLFRKDRPDQEQQAETPLTQETSTTSDSGVQLVGVSRRGNGSIYLVRFRGRTIEATPQMLMQYGVDPVYVTGCALWNKMETPARLVLCGETF